MYYRRKIILGLLDLFDGKLEKYSFQKLLLLLGKMQEKPSFDFVPYKQGAFSFQSYADMRTMMKYGQVSENEKHWVKEDKVKYLDLLTAKDKQLLLYLKAQYGKMSANELIKHTYIKYPYYATKSQIAHKLLNEKEMKAVRNATAHNSKAVLYTIGYEGKSLEKYINDLIGKDVKVLCDVRKNPFSMKYGFNKSQLNNACENVGIKYVHIPDLGIESDKRQNLKTQKDYDKLFAEYEKTTLKKNGTALEQVNQLVNSEKRVAITCFEAEHCQCHRGRVANALSALPNRKYEIAHL